MTYAYVYAKAAREDFPPDGAERTVERMSRGLLCDALAERVDLGDERAIDSRLVESGFTRTEIDLYGVTALERTRFRLQRRAAMLDRGERAGAAIGLALWVGLFVAGYAILCPLPARAAERVTEHATWVELIPVVVALVLLAALICLVLWRTKPLPLSLVDDESDAAAASDCNPEGRR
jgi:hypothetical protein